MNENSALITEIERFAVHDGPGIRTLVFLKGCPLHCLWCCNPETQSPAPELAYTRAKCLQCGTCVAVCEANALGLNHDALTINRTACNACGTCVGECTSDALAIAGQAMTPEEVFAQVMRDAEFYRKSGGGVTLSGGEPLASPRFTRGFLELCKSANFHTALETCGYAAWSAFERVLPFLDLVLFDIKHFDSEKHRQGTGVSNEQILDNLGRLNDAGVEIFIRVPLVPAFNDSVENIRRTSELAARLGRVKRVDLLPYHRLGKAKYEKIGLRYELEEMTPPDRAHVEQLKCIVEEFGIPATIGG